MQSSGYQTEVRVPLLVRESLIGGTRATSAYLKICEDIQVLKLSISFSALAIKKLFGHLDG